MGHLERFFECLVPWSLQCGRAIPALDGYMHGAESSPLLLLTWHMIWNGYC